MIATSLYTGIMKADSFCAVVKKKFHEFQSLKLKDMLRVSNFKMGCKAYLTDYEKSLITIIKFFESLGWLRYKSIKGKLKIFRQFSCEKESKATRKTMAK